MAKEVKKHVNLFRILAICGFVALSIGTYQNITMGCNPNKEAGHFLYPFFAEITPYVNGLCALVSLAFCFIPTYTTILAAIMLIQAVQDVLTGFYILGTFIYAFCLVIMFCLGYGRGHFKQKVAIALLIWLVVITTLIPKYGLSQFFFAFGISIFAGASYVSIYRILSDQLSYLVYDVAVPDCRPEIALPEKGSTLDLHKLNLTERQITCIHYTLDSTWNYKKIANVLCTSESTVKKDMQDLYRLFGVKNRELLRLLLIQYKIL